VFEDFAKGDEGSFEHRFWLRVASRLNAIYAAADFRWIHDPDTCRADWLRYLAEERCVDVWDANWSEETKRNVLRTWPKIHRIKGTKAAMDLAIDACGYGPITFTPLRKLVFDGTWTFDGAEVFWDEPNRWAQYNAESSQAMTIWQGQQVREFLERVGPARNKLNNLTFVAVAHSYNSTIAFDGTWPFGGA
jgi:hypothetical protein